MEIASEMGICWAKNTRFHRTYGAIAIDFHLWHGIKGDMVVIVRHADGNDIILGKEHGDRCFVYDVYGVYDVYDVYIYMIYLDELQWERQRPLAF